MTAGKFLDAMNLPALRRRALGWLAVRRDLAKCRGFCEKWARLQSAEYEFSERRVVARELLWRISFIDLHKWSGRRVYWNGHDIAPAEGRTRAEAWRRMADVIIRHENASSEAEALLKAEIAFRRSKPRGWGDVECKAFYGRLARGAQ